MLFLDFIAAKIEKNLELVTLSGILLRKSQNSGIIYGKRFREHLFSVSD